MKKIYLNELKKVLSPKEMKNVLGGSGVVGTAYCVCCKVTNDYSGCSKNLCLTSLSSVLTECGTSYANAFLSNNCSTICVD